MTQSPYALPALLLTGAAAILAISAAVHVYDGNPLPIEHLSATVLTILGAGIAIFLVSEDQTGGEE